MIIYDKRNWLNLFKILLLYFFIIDIVNTQNIPKNIDMIFLESISGLPSRYRLTLWNNGNSEIKHDHGFTIYDSDRYILEPKWKKILEKDSTSVVFIYKNYYSQEVALKMFNEALLAGIHLLEPYDPILFDGGGTLVGVRIDGKIIKTTISLDLDNTNSENIKRFMEIIRILNNDYLKIKSISLVYINEK